MLTKFKDAGFIKPIDFHLAKQLGGPDSTALQAFLIHLSIAMRRGHVCVDGFDNVRSIWELIEPEGELHQIAEEEWHQLSNLIKDGYRSIPTELVQTPSVDIPVSLKPLVFDGSKIYTQRCWLAESQFKKNLNDFLHRTPDQTTLISETEIHHSIEAHGLTQKLLKEQKEAIVKSTAPLSLIAGGPGTGKTFTAGWIISLLAEILESKLGRPPVIALAAPTGKAALHLEKSVQNKHELVGVTLHSLLSKLPLHADLIVVDEASMIDLEWMNKLLKAIPKGARLIMIGDPHQLPPVGMGSIFVDMIQTMPHTHLEQCLRTDLQSIVNYASKIKQGIYTEWDATSILQDEKTIIDKCVEAYKDCRTPDDFNRFKMLTPFTKGTFGADNLNKKILHALEKPEAIPILITKNDYELELFNGEQGIWIPERRIVQFPKRTGEGIREIPFGLLGSHQLGYCLTIHKSQGSEYSHVVIAYPEGAQIFGREALYTAVTRAKRTLEIYAAPNVLQQAIERSNRRMSGL